MTTTVKSVQEYYDLYKNEVQANAGELTDFEEGSLHDIIAGALTTGMNELNEYVLTQFTKTFFDTAHGPEVTGGPDDLQTLAVDHFGDTFARPGAIPSSGIVTFSRPTSGAGNVNIGTNVIVKTPKDSSGKEIRFQVTQAVVLTGLTIQAEVECLEDGIVGNVDIGAITVIESALTDSTVTVTNAAKFQNGLDQETDAEYRETIRGLIQALAGATKAAIQGALESVPGVQTVTLLEEDLPVIQYDIGGDQIEPGAEYFRIPYPVAYIADANGTASLALLQAAKEAIMPIKACGVSIDIRAAVAVLFDWTASITLNAGGPNFAELSTDPQKILDSMEEYIESLPIGTGFDKVAARAAILAIWGPSGTNDLTNFTTTSPVGNVTINGNEKLVPDDMEIA